MEIKERIGGFGRFSIYLGINTDDTDRIKDKDEWKGEDFAVACERVRRIFNQLEEHEDFESLLKYKKLFEKICVLTNEVQADMGQKQLNLQRDMGEIDDIDCIEYPYDNPFDNG